MHLVLGLGNPGARYDDTRHNVGFRFTDQVASGNGGVTWKVEHKALVTKLQIAGKPILLAKPQTFMNLSGESAQALITFYKIPKGQIVVFVDDVALPLGALRIRQGGGAGGHNGLKDLIARVGEDFTRIRIGVGPCPPEQDLADFVLRKYGETEKKILQPVIESALPLLTLGIQEGWDKAGNRFNRRVEGPTL